MSELTDRVIESILKDCRKRVKNEYKEENATLKRELHTATQRLKVCDKKVEALEEKLKEVQLENHNLTASIRELRENARDWACTMKSFQKELNEVMNMKLADILDFMSYVDVVKYCDGAQGILEFAGEKVPNRRRRRRRR